MAILEPNKFNNTQVSADDTSTLRDARPQADQGKTKKFLRFAFKGSHKYVTALIFLLVLSALFCGVFFLISQSADSDVGTEVSNH